MQVRISQSFVQVFRAGAAPLSVEVPPSLRADAVSPCSGDMKRHPAQHEHALDFPGRRRLRPAATIPLRAAAKMRVSILRGLDCDLRVAAFGLVYGRIYPRARRLCASDQRECVGLVSSVESLSITRSKTRPIKPPTTLPGPGTRTVPIVAPIAVCRRNGNGTISVGRVRVGRGDTTISVEPEFWDQFKLIAFEHRTTISALLAEIDRTMRLLPHQSPGRHRVRTLSAAVRVFVLQMLISRSSSGARRARVRAMRRDAPHPQSSSASRKSAVVEGVAPDLY